tara:strand:- start:19130 stop:19555 length:426 start_codon:yes stop_codon:yes gene_type:complete
MKKSMFFAMLFVALATFSCKNSESKEASSQSEENSQKLMDSKYTSYTGEYFYSEDGAVLKGNQFIYAVTLDDMAKELGERISSIKKEEYDMVPVVVIGEVQRNPALDEGKEVWEQIITIKEIVSVGSAPAEADIKIEESKS